MIAGWALPALALFGAADVQHGPGTPEKIGAWEIATETDRMTDKTSIEAKTESADGGGLLSYYCGARGPVWIVTTREYQGEGRFRDLTWRVDSGPPRETRWHYGDHSALSPPQDGAAFSRAVAGGARVLFRLYSYRFYTTDIEFDITGAAQAMARVNASCAAR